MLQVTENFLNECRIILASTSSRRLDILHNLGVKVEQIGPNYEEDLDRSEYTNHGDFVADLAYYKVDDVYQRLKNDKNQSDSRKKLIIGADTLVTLNDTIYGKPKDEAEAIKTITELSGKEHILYTGVCINFNGKVIKFYDTAKVRIGTLTQEQIKRYAQTKEPYDKAGGYGIQGVGGFFIKSIDGDINTVIGLPLYELVQQLNKLAASISS